MGDKKNYSIKEIARIADVSPATVSRVMNKTT
ncbi:MAG: LacI family DNA-binding transcriptional regulator, partial [Erysipelotrichales bacterium]